MASYLFKNVYTGDTKVVNSKDAATAKRVYTNKTWEYVKAVPQQKVKKVRLSATDIQTLWLQSCELVSCYDKIRDYAETFDCKGLRPMYIDMQDTLGKMQRILRQAV